MIRNAGNKSVRAIEKLNLPTTVAGVTTSYAHVENTYRIDHDTDADTYTDVLIGTRVDTERYSGKSKAEVLEMLSSEKDSLMAEYSKTLSELNSMIDQLEGE